MAYTPKRGNSMPVPVEPAVIPVYVKAADTEILISIPWTNCQLVHMEGCFKTAEATDVGTIDAELNAAGGTVMMSLAVSATQTAGSVAEATVSDAAAMKRLDRSSDDRGAINLAMAGSAADYDCIIYMYFERN